MHRLFICFFFIGLPFLEWSCASKKAVSTSRPAPVKESTTNVESNALEKYEQKFGIQLPKDFDRGLAEMLASWIGSPYKYGGNSTSGTDCSGFVQHVYTHHYRKAIPRSSEQMMLQSKKIGKNALKEGDLLFFKTGGNKTDHVGMHLTETYFVHASTKRGVIISSLTEPYYTKTFVQYGSFR